MGIATENIFETALVQSLVEQGGYTEGNAPTTVLNWVCSNMMLLSSCKSHNPSGGIKSVPFMVKISSCQAHKKS